jgi:hypothetical protein
MEAHDMPFRSRFTLLRPRSAALLLAAIGAVGALVLAGCGDKSLILRVDILSFLSASDKQSHYGPVPGGLSDSVTVTAARSLSLLPGIKDITVVQNVEIDAAGVFANTTGSGTGTVKIFLSPEGTDPFTADLTPIVLPVTLTPATNDTVRVVVAGDQQLKDLFVGNKAELGIRATLAASAGPAVEGDFTLTELRAIVTARQGITDQP